MRKALIRHGQRGAPSRPAGRPRSTPRSRRRRSENAQGMVEFALIFPFVLFVVFFCIDAGRLVYAYNAISSIARDGARTASLATQFQSDCLTLSRVETAGQGFPINADPNSVVGNTDPNSPGAVGPTKPAVGQGYVYVFPAVAVGSPPDSSANCSSNTSRQWATQPHDVSVQVEYTFVPLTPMTANLLGGITIKTISVEQVEPCPGGSC
jgi:Flp pilus assembly protein TadG